MEQERKLALLIDAENTSAAKIEQILREVSQYGSIILRRAYGNWRKEGLKSWENTLMQHAIKPIQQFDYVSGKSTTDFALVIDAMHLLYSGLYDGFAIVSSDSDFTPLAIHLREGGKFVIGIGGESTVEAFRKSCNIFTVLKETPIRVQPAKVQPAVPVQKKQPCDLEKIHDLLEKVFQKNKTDNGYAYVSAAGSAIKKYDSTFKPKNYGYSNLNGLIAGFPKKYAIQRNGSVDMYRCLNQPQQTSKPGKNTMRHQKQILEYLDEHGSAKRKEFDELLQLQASRTGVILHDLVAEGVLVTDGGRQNRVYKRNPSVADHA